jgi:arsenate reductase
MTARPPSKRVVFVCVQNANRSQMAEAFARMHGAGRVEPYSAGSRPSGHVNPKAVEGMREVGYDLTQHRSKNLSELTGIEFDLAVTMGCGDECPFIKAKRRVDWNIPDPKQMPPDQFREVRNLIGCCGKYNPRFPCVFLALFTSVWSERLVIDQPQARPKTRTVP